MYMYIKEASFPLNTMELSFLFYCCVLFNYLFLIQLSVINRWQEKIKTTLNGNL